MLEIGLTVPSAATILNADAYLRELAARVAQMQTQAVALVVDSPEQVQTAIDLTGLIAKAKKALEDRRTAEVKPLNDGVKRINELFKGWSGPLEAADSTIRGKVMTYRQEQERLRREEEARLQELQRKEQARLAKAAEKKGLEAPPAPAPIVVPQAVPTVRTDTATASMRKVWKYDVTDKAAVPESFKLVNEAAIGAAVRAGVREIAGVRIFEVEELAVRAR